MTRRSALGALGALGGAPWGEAVANESAVRTIVWPQQLPLIGAPPLRRADLHERAVVLCFSSSQCAYCLRQDVHLQRLHQQAGDELLVLGVATESSEEDVRTLARTRGWTFPWTSAHQTLAALLRPRRVLPLTYLVGRAGVVLRTIPGEMSESDVLELGDIARRVTSTDTSLVA